MTGRMSVPRTQGTTWGATRESLRETRETAPAAELPHGITRTAGLEGVQTGGWKGTHGGEHGRPSRGVAWPTDLTVSYAFVIVKLSPFAKASPKGLALRKNRGVVQCNAKEGGLGARRQTTSVQYISMMRLWSAIVRADRNSSGNTTVATPWTSFSFAISGSKRSSAL